MLIREILQEDDVSDEITNDLMDILMAYKQKGKTFIPMKTSDTEEGILTFLKKIGYDLNTHTISDLLTKSPFDSIVKRAGTDKIELKSDEPETTAPQSELEKSEKHVDRVAKKRAKKDVKSGKAE
jgi:hypothetical protein